LRLTKNHLSSLKRFVGVDKFELRYSRQRPHPKRYAAFYMDYKDITLRQILTITNIVIGLTIKSQCIYTFAGDGTLAYGGDSVQATSAQLYDPKGVTVDLSGNVYMTESSHHIRKISTNGIITTIGGGSFNGLGDGGPALQAQFLTPTGIAVDTLGNIYIADYNNHRIRIINSSGIVNTFAGGGSSQADSVAATSAWLSYPNGVAVDKIGNVYISDFGHAKIRMVNQAGIITTIAGNGLGTYSGDGGPATSASINGPVGITVDNANNIYFADYYNNRIRKINTNGIITTVAGNGTGGFSGDGALATNAKLNQPQGVAIDGLGNIFITDWSNGRIRKVDPSGIITTYAGTGTWGGTGDNGPASLATITQPFGITVDVTGSIYFSDVANNKLRKVSPTGCATGISTNKLNDKSLFLSPNPSSGSFNVEINFDIKNGHFVLYNSLGQAVFKQSITQGLNTVETRGLAKGLYYYGFFQDNNLICADKCVLD
jgi:streptogramin lyase